MFWGIIKLEVIGAGNESEMSETRRVKRRIRTAYLATGPWPLSGGELGK